MHMVRTMDPVEARFWPKVRVGLPDECWPWMAGTYRNGLRYGRFKVDGRTWPAHRYAWVLSHGLVPKGLQICHHCDNPLCCNERHLFSGTAAENSQDRDRKGRRFPNAGSAYPLAKLTESDIPVVLAIRSLGLTLDQVAPLFGVSPAAISLLQSRKTWRHHIPV